MNAPPSIDTSRHARDVDSETTPISRFAEDYEMPLDLAVRLIGRTEDDTVKNIDTMKRYLRHVINRSREYGYPLTTHRIET